MPTLRDGFQLFRGQPREVNVAVVLVGYALATVVYLAVLIWDGRLDQLTSNDVAAIRARQSAVVVTGVIVGGYFGICFTRALGGPVLNIASAAIAPLVVPLFVGLTLGSLPTPTVAQARTAGFLGEALHLGLPGLLTAFTVILARGTISDTDEAWALRHLPVAFRSVEEPATDGTAPNGRSGSNADSVENDVEQKAPSKWRIGVVSALFFVIAGVLSMILLSIVPFSSPYYVEITLLIVVCCATLWWYGTKRYAGG